jgi:hypothetical protein
MAKKHNHPRPTDIPPTAAICLMVSVSALTFAVVTEAPVLAVVGLVAAVVTVASWIDRNAG